ncbi:hypothetical protein D3C72_1759900 [compost metagenome]
MAPLAGDAVGTGHQLAAHAEAAARTGAQDRPEHARVARTGTRVGLAQGKALQVVAERQRPLQAGLQVISDQAPGQAGHVRAQLAAAAAIAHAGQADADRPGRRAERRVGCVHQAGDGLQEGVVIPGGRGDPLAVPFVQGGVVGHQLDLGAAHVDAVPVLHGNALLSHGDGWSRPARPG